MKRQIRRGVFETNSSSVHSLTMCSGDEYDKWAKGEFVYDTYEEKLIPVEGKDPDYEENERYLSFDQYEEYYGNHEIFEDCYKLPDGQKVVTFGHYGYDG